MSPHNPRATRFPNPPRRGDSGPSVRTPFRPYPNRRDHDSNPRKTRTEQRPSAPLLASRQDTRIDGLASARARGRKGGRRRRHGCHAFSLSATYPRTGLARQATNHQAPTRSAFRCMRWGANAVSNYSRCLFWVISGHCPASASCPLCPRKRTRSASKSMSALRPITDVGRTSKSAFGYRFMALTSTLLLCFLAVLLGMAGG